MKEPYIVNNSHLGKEMDRLKLYLIFECKPYNNWRKPMETCKLDPPEHLKSFIKSYIVQVIDVETTGILIPAWTQNFIFFQIADYSDMVMVDESVVKGRAFMMTGAMTQATKFSGEGEKSFRAIVAELQPLALYSLLKKDISFLTDTSVEGSEIFTTHETIIKNLQSAGSLDDKMVIVNEFFTEIFDGVEYEPIPVVAKAIEEFQNPQDEVFQVAQFTKNFNISETHFRRLFQKSTGLTPNLYYRIKRLEHILSELHKNPDQKYLDLLKGYVDQSHFIKDFTRFTGKKPTQLLELFRDAGVKETFNNL